MSKHHAVFPRGYRTGRFVQGLIYWSATRSQALRAFFFGLPPSRFRVWFVARYYHRLLEDLGNGRFGFLRAVEPDGELRMFFETFVGREAWHGALTSWLQSFESPRFELTEIVFGDRTAFCSLHLGGRGTTSGLSVEDLVYFVTRVENGQAVRARFTESRSDALEAAGLSE